MSSLSVESLQTVQDKKTFLLKNMSYSSNLTLHSCQKRWQLDKLGGSLNEDAEEEKPGSVTFAFGHAMGAGLQTLFLPGKTKQDAYLAAFLAWDVPLTDELEKKKKSFWYVLKAIDLAEHLVNEIKGEGWELASLDGVPAIEYSFVVHLPGDYRFAAHIDLILYHPEKDKYRVIEVKTTGFSHVHESVYGNSSQALSYSIVLDYLVKHKTSYDVLYIVYKCPSMEFELFSFPKSNLAKAEWIRDVLYDCRTIDHLLATNYFPKRGEACYSFFSPCPYYGGCGYGDEFLGVDNEKMFDRLVQQQVNNTKIDRHNKRGYDIEISLEELLKDRMLVLQIEEEK